VDLQYVIQLGRSAIYTTLLVAMPMLAFSLVIGLAIAILQAITQIHEMTLTFIPKIISVALALIIFLPWMINMVLSYTNQLFAMIPALAH
jgi:flagellar biosynthetic protein FliQ